MGTRRLSRGDLSGVPVDPDGYVDVQELRRLMNVPPNRMLVQEEHTGESFLLPRSGKTRLGAYSRFIDAPRAERG